MNTEHFDVIIIGAGLSGIGAACHLKRHCPDKRILLLEARETMGGTWDLFRYPGVRSDSDMFTLGYSFRPWLGAKAITDGASILDYVRDTARAYKVDRHIRFGHRATRADWSGDGAIWTLEVERGGAEPIRLSCNFLLGCSGYYDYANGHMPDFPGIAQFAGQVVHPQRWPEGLRTEGKRIVLIGSGATAVTLAPTLARTAASVTLLQRSPSYVVSLPSEDGLAKWLRARVSDGFAYKVVRWRNVLLGIYLYRSMRSKPVRARERIAALMREAVGPDYDTGAHFTPAYNPWDQRLCIVPDGDLFEALRDGTVEMATDTIESFTKDGIRLASGGELAADLVISATGLQMQFLGGIRLSVNGVAVDPAHTTVYKGMMLSDVPNFALTFGYTNASWTLKADLTSAYVCRLLNFMTRRGYDWCVAPRDPAVGEQPLLNFSSGYVQRSIGDFPKQGERKPWRVYQNYLLDLLSTRTVPLRDGTMTFRRLPSAAGA